MDSGKGNEPMLLDDADSRLHHGHMTADESVPDNMKPSKRQRTSELTVAQTKPLKAAGEDEEIGLNIFDNNETEP